MRITFINVSRYSGTRSRLLLESADKQLETLTESERKNFDTLVEAEQALNEAVDIKAVFNIWHDEERCFSVRQFTESK